MAAKSAPVRAGASAPVTSQVPEAPKSLKRIASVNSFFASRENQDRIRISNLTARVIKLENDNENLSKDNENLSKERQALLNMYSRVRA